ncbi:DUF4294 domain-containing protein [Prolixibacteraceae bacterium JC049]|nr:DUF4294 domain-containing protein [Prolixibacteraceae bacterium JC049]
MYKFVFLLSLLLFAFGGFAQKKTGKDTVMYGSKVMGADTLPHRNLKEVSIFPRKNFANNRQYKRYRRMAYRLKKVMPYAKEAAKLLVDFEERFAKETDKKKRRKYVKEIEKQLMAKYGKELKRLSISEGRLLIRLIDRETGSTTYQLVRELRGGFSAFFWQSVARIFGNNLKTEYEPNGQDKMIEEIIQMIEKGEV